MALPTRGQSDWDDEVAAHVGGIEANVAAAAAAAEVARTNATTAISIAQDAAAKVDAFRSVPDAATASLVTDGPLTSAALSAAYVARLGGSDGVVDAAPYFQAALDAGVSDIHLKPGGVYRLLTPVFSDSTDPRLRITVHMNGAKIVVDRSAGTLPTASAFISPDTRWAWFDNVLRAGLTGSAVDVTDSAYKASGASNPSKGRISFENGTIDGLATDVGLVYGNTSGAYTRRCVFYRIKYGISWSGYADSCVMDHPHVVSPVTGGWLVKQENLGDGVAIIHPKGVGAGIWHAISCHGGKVTGAVAGGFQFQSCQSIDIDTSHIELDEVGGFGTTFVVDRSQVRLTNHYAHLGKGVSKYVVQINDSAADPLASSDVTIEGGTHVFYLRSTETDSARDPAVYITAANAGAKLAARNVRTVINGQAEGLGARFQEGMWLDSAIGGIQTAIAAGADQIASGSFDLLQRDGAWQVIAPNGVARPARPLAVPTLSVATTTDVLGALSNGTTYEYVAAIKTADGRYSGLPAATSVAAGASGAIAINLTVPGGDAVVAVWRKTTAGVTTAPDRYIELPLGGYTTRWYDTGTRINGRAWQTSSLPVPNTVAGSGAVTSRLNGLALATGQSTMDRRDATSGSTTISSGAPRFTYMVASKTEAIASVRAITGSTAASGLTLARVGIYSVDGKGSLTLIASTANDATLFAATNTAYTKALSAPVTLSEGSLYAVAVMVVGTTGPAIQAAALSTGAAQFTSVYPPIVTGLGGQADLPASVAVGSLSAQTAPLYVELLP